MKITPDKLREINSVIEKLIGTQDYFLVFHIPEVGMGVASNMSPEEVIAMAHHWLCNCVYQASMVVERNPQL